MSIFSKLIDKVLPGAPSKKFTEATFDKVIAPEHKDALEAIATAAITAGIGGADALSLLPGADNQGGGFGDLFGDLGGFGDVLSGGGINLPGEFQEIADILGQLGLPEGEIPGTIGDILNGNFEDLGGLGAALSGGGAGALGGGGGNGGLLQRLGIAVATLAATNKLTTKEQNAVRDFQDQIKRNLGQAEGNIAGIGELSQSVIGGATEALARDAQGLSAFERSLRGQGALRDQSNVGRLERQLGTQAGQPAGIRALAEQGQQQGLQRTIDAFKTATLGRQNEGQILSNVVQATNSGLAPLQIAGAAGRPLDVATRQLESASGGFADVIGSVFNPPESAASIVNQIGGIPQAPVAQAPVPQSSSLDFGQLINPQTPPIVDTPVPSDTGRVFGPPNPADNIRTAPPPPVAIPTATQTQVDDVFSNNQRTASSLNLGPFDPRRNRNRQLARSF